MQIFLLFFVLSVFGWAENGVDGYLSLLGRSDLADDDIRNMMEIYNIYDRGLRHYCHYGFFAWQPKKISFPYSAFKQYLSPSTKMDQYREVFRNDSNYLTHIGETGRELTELLSVIMVKFVCMVNAIQYTYGHLVLANEGKKMESSSCARLAIRFGWFGIEVGDIFDAIQSATREKYPLGNEMLETLYDEMFVLHNFVSWMIITRPKENGDLILLPRATWNNIVEVEEAVKTVNQYLRIMLFGETSMWQSTSINLRGGRELWMKAVSIENKLLTEITMGEASQVSSHLTPILREIDLHKARKDSKDELQFGLQNEFLTLGPRSDSAKLPSTFTVPLIFQRKRIQELWIWETE